MSTRRARHLRARWRAGWRDTQVLLRQFSWPLIWFCAAIVGGGLIYHGLANLAGENTSNLVEAIYRVLLLIFLQSYGDFPNAWYLEAFYFLMPVVGLAIFAQGIADFGIAFFNRRVRNREWEIAVASTLSQHIILVGLGHLGYRVACTLQQMEQELAVIEVDPQADLLESIRHMGIPIIEQDASRGTALELANVASARSIILCTQNDALNLQIALKARSLNPKIEVVVRIFDDDFADALGRQFGFRAFSATGMAAPAFAAAAAGADMTRPITIEGHPMSLAKLQVAAGSELDGTTVQAIEHTYKLSVVMLKRQSGTDLHPAVETQLHAGDILAVLGSPDQINLLLPHNRA